MQESILEIVRRGQPLSRGDIASRLRGETPWVKTEEVYRCINQMLTAGLIVEKCEVRWGELLMKEYEGFEIEMPDQYIRIAR